MKVTRWTKRWILIGFAIPLLIFASPAGILWAPNAVGGSGCRVPPGIVFAFCPPIVLTMVMFDDTLRFYNLAIMALVVVLSVGWWVSMGLGIRPVWQHFHKRG